MRDLPPTFVLSLDTELIWGSFDHTTEEAFASSHRDVRPAVRDLLALLEEYEISATWAVVGHLFLPACRRGPDGRAHPELVRPEYRWYPGDWLGDDPCTDRATAPLWYGDDLIDLVLSARVPQELGSHSFSHVVFGDEGCSERAAESDVAACVRVAEERGLRLRSFVFPRNAEGHHGVLLRHGFDAFRGEDPTWFRDLSGPVKRAAHLVDQALGITPPVSTPVEVLPGLWNVPGSMLLLHRAGVRRLIPFRSRVAKARRGLRRAVAHGQVFHLWTHPENLVRDRVGMFEALRAILEEVATLRERGSLRVMTMGQVVQEMASARA